MKWIRDIYFEDCVGAALGLAVLFGVALLFFYGLVYVWRHA